jgi:hypothetical protein
MDTIGVAITVTRPVWLASTPLGWTPNSTTDMRWIGDLAAGQSGSVTYVLTLPVTYTLDMNAFVLTFFIEDGGPGGLAKAHDQSLTSVGVPDLSIVQVIGPPAIVPGQKFTATLIISNTGLGRACNPKAPGCGGFTVDVFIPPTAPPQSYPFGGYGDRYTNVPALSPGLSATVYISNIQFTASQPMVLYFKVDNWDCAIFDPCLPSGSQGGLVPEYNELNNRVGPIVLTGFVVRLPLVMKQ